MTKQVLAVLTLATAAAALFQTARIGVQPDGSILVPTGQRLTPAGVHIEVSDRPLGMVQSPDGGLLAVVTGSNFGPRNLHLIDIGRKSAIDAIPIGDSFVGVAFDATGRKLYIGGGREDEVKLLERDDGGRFRLSAAVKVPGSAPSGLALRGDGRKLYVALNLKHAVAVVDTFTREVSEVPVGSYPYTVVIARSKVYVSNWGGRRPAANDRTLDTFPVVLDARGIPSSGTLSVLDGASGKVLRHIEVGLHPSAMAVSPDGNRLYVANANSDSISMVDT